MVLILIIFFYGNFGLGPVRRSYQSSSFVGAEAEQNKEKEVRKILVKNQLDFSCVTSDE